MRFGKLLALKIDVARKAKDPRNNHWICLCDCGKKTSVITSGLTTGHTKSCGCGEAFKNLKTHGMTGQRPYRIWRHILARCENPKASHYDRYGGRGIAICERWHKFENFLEDMGIPFEGATIERINNNDNYYKENCRWATRKEQSQNTRRNIFLTYKGKTKILKEWAGITGINHCTLLGRIKAGWTTERALSTPTLWGNQYSK